MKSSLYLLALLLIACRREQHPSAEAVYTHARHLLQIEQLSQAATEADRGLAIAPPGSVLCWQFRLLRAEIFLARREPAAASAALESNPPGKPEFRELNARYQLCQAHLALLLHNKSGARAHIDQAHKIAEALPPGRLMPEIQLRRGSIAAATDDFAAAQRDTDQVLSYATAHADDFLRLNAEGSMGYMLLQGDRYDEAVPWLERAAADAKSLGAHLSEARATGNLGYCFFELGELNKALRYFRRAENRFATEGNRYERQIWLGNIGNIEEVSREYQRAAKDYTEALSMARSLHDDYWTAVWLDDLASLSVERRDWDAAERFTQQALASKQRVGDDKSRSYSAVNAGQIANGRAQYNQAEQIFRDVLRRSNQDVFLVLEAHAGLAEAHAARHHDADAISDFRAAVREMDRQQSALLDEEQKLSWFSSVIRTYQQYVEFLMDRGRTSEALAVVESSRGRVLTSRLGQAVSKSLPNPRDLQRIADRSGNTLLVYFVAPQTSYAWVIEKGSVRNFRLPGEADLRKQVSSYQTFIQQLRDPLREPCSAGESLYRQLIEPAHITGKHVLLSPDGPLYSLDFASLPVPSPAGTHYLLEDLEVSIVPSFDTVRSQPAPRSRSLLLIGDPVSPDPDFADLAFASQEMNGIQQRLASVHKVTYSRDQARPDVYLKSNPGDFSWIHFVAHATANEDEPLQSAVVLSRAPGSGYRLFAKDVIRVPLKAELVTISACRGAGTKVYEGEGLVGFSWAFLRSGAHNVIAGLWDVNDRSTAELMTGLYAGIASGAAPADALRSTQLTMARSNGVYRKPYYWAPFETFTRLE